ncbi:DUF6350 family protein, partial [Streptomyces boncukensis]
KRQRSGGPAAAFAAAGWVAAGYLLVACGAVVYACGGPMRVDVVSAAWRLPLLVAAVCAYCVWRARGSPVPRSPRLCCGERAEVSVRAGLAGVVALCGAGAALLGVALLRRPGAVQHSFPQLTESVPGRFGMLLLAVALAPNAVLWAVAYGLGPGFTLGAGSVVSPLGTEGTAGMLAQLPPFPLLVAVPETGAGGPAVWCLAGAV